MRIIEKEILGYQAKVIEDDLRMSNKKLLG
jgi:hypothetical protein